MMNQTAQIAGEKKLKLVVFRGALTLSGHKKNLLDAATWVAAEFETKMKGKHG